MSPAQILQKRCDTSNSAKPENNDKTGYQCPKCNNKGIFYFVVDAEIKVSLCDCLEFRKSLKQLQQSGLSQHIKDYTFENFITQTSVQRDIKLKATKYAQTLLQGSNDWFLMCGQPGGGKTHICTAISGELLSVGRAVRYMLWKDEAPALKANINEDEEYQRLLRPLIETDILYIDDFLKTHRGEKGIAARPPTGDLNLAFVIINSRYVSKKPTIISCEHDIDTLLSFDEAVASRIYERSKNHSVVVPLNIENNFRMRR